MINETYLWNKHGIYVTEIFF